MKLKNPFACILLCPAFALAQNTFQGNVPVGKAEIRVNATGLRDAVPGEPIGDINQYFHPLSFRVISVDIGAAGRDVRRGSGALNLDLFNLPTGPTDASRLFEAFRGNSFIGQFSPKYTSLSSNNCTLSMVYPQPDNASNGLAVLYGGARENVVPNIFINLEDAQFQDISGSDCVDFINGVRAVALNSTFQFVDVQVPQPANVFLEARSFLGPAGPPGGSNSPSGPPTPSDNPGTAASSIKHAWVIASFLLLASFF